MGAGERRDEGTNPPPPAAPWQIEIDSVAKIELATAIIHYELSRAGLGERFRIAVEAMIAKIAAHPFVYQKLNRTHHRAVMRVFPYTLYFAVHKKTHRILILNIHHGKRHPKNWRRSKPSWRT